MGEPRLGKQPPRYAFFLNPYQDARFTTKCPDCEGKTKQKKLPLVVHVENGRLVSINITCRFCPSCDLLIAHKDEIENILAQLFQQLDPNVIGNDYLVLGTVDRSDWKRGLSGNLMPKDLLDVLHDFKKVVQIERICGWMTNEEFQRRSDELEARGFR